MVQPLTGVTVVEIADLRGEYCGRLLADLGARVIKVEAPTGGPSRNLAPTMVFPDGTRHSLVHEHYNANKLSVTADLSQPQGCQLVQQLAAAADVLLLGLDVPELRRCGLLPAEVAGRHPGLVVTAITGFGMTGPRSDWRVTDLVGFAAGGLMSISGEPGRPPTRAAGNQAFDMAGAHAAVGTMIALWERNRSGRGQVVDISIQEAQATEEHVIARYSEDGGLFPREGSQHQVSAPGRVYPCKHGFLYLMVSPTRPEDWDRFLEWADRPAELAGPEWIDWKYRRERVEFVDEVTRAFTRSRDRDDLCVAAQALRLPCVPVHTPAEFLHHPHTRDREYLVPLDHPDLGPVQAPGPPFRMAAGAWMLRSAAPTLGRHNAEVLAWLASAADAPAAGSAPAHVVAAAAGTAAPMAMAAGVGERRAALTALQGLRVLDFSHMVAGPYATLLLAYCGAEVIKVESTLHPDGFRVREGSDLNSSRPFADFNRNKLGVTINLKTSAGKDLIRSLAASCDVVVENFSAGVMARLGLDYPDLAALNPGIIMISMPGLGRTGPCRNWFTWGPNIQHWVGMSELWTEPGRPEPVGTQASHADYVGGVHAAAAIMAALHMRAKTGHGQMIELAQSESAAALMGPALLEVLLAGRDPVRRGNAAFEGAPHGVYPCAGSDRWIALAAVQQHEWEHLCALTAAAWCADDRFGSPALRLQHQAALDELLATWTATQDANDLAARLQAAGIPACPMMDGADLSHDPHLAARRFLCRVEHPAMQPLTFPGVPMVLSRTPGGVWRHAPLLGQDTEAVCRHLLGCTDAQIAELKSAQALT